MIPVLFLAVMAVLGAFMFAYQYGLYNCVEEIGYRLIHFARARRRIIARQRLVLRHQPRVAPANVRKISAR